MQTPKRIGRYEAACSFVSAQCKPTVDLTSVVSMSEVALIAFTFDRDTRDVAVEVWRNAGRPATPATKTAEKAEKPASVPAPAFREDVPIGAQ